MCKTCILLPSAHLNSSFHIDFFRRTAAECLTAVILLAVGSIASAQTNPVYWTDASTDNTWTNVNNWTNSFSNPQVPATTNDLFFIDAGTASVSVTGPTGTPDNIVNSGFTIKSLIYQSTNFNHTTLLNPGVTLSVLGSGTYAYALFAGNLVDSTASLNEYATIIGPGATLALTNLNGSLSVRQGESSSSHTATLDMRGLDTLAATVTNLLCGGELTLKDTGTLYLAKTNFITITAPSNTAGFIIGNNNTSGSKTASAYLGLTNVIFCDGGLAMPNERMTANLNFYSNNSAAYFRNQAGTGRQNQWSIGWNDTSGTGTGTTGTANFSLGTVDAMIGTLIVGANETSGSSTGGGTGTLTFYGGTINANNVLIAETFGTVPGTVNGTINVAAINAPAQLIINSNLSMGLNGGTITPNATLNISSGAVVTVFGNIITGYGTSGVGMPGNTVINLLGASLYMGGTMGAASSSTGPLNTLTLSNSVLTINLGLSPNPVNPLCTVGTLDAITNCTLDIEGGAISAGQFSVIKYSSIEGLGFGAFTNLTLPSQAQGYLSNNVNNSSIDLVVTNVFSPIWNGTINGNWDINTTANWKTSGGAPLDYEQTAIPGNLVTFSDTAAGTTNINLVATNLAPSSINVNNSMLNYKFAGSGQLVGPGGLSKNGSGSLVIANTGTNSFLGSIGIGGGLLQLGVSNGLPSTANFTLADVMGATFDLNSFNQTIASLSGGGSDGGGNVTLGTGTLTISGSGGNYSGIISGNGGVVMAGGSQVFNQANTYTGNTIITGGTLILANGYGSGSATGSGGVDIAGGALQFGGNSSGYDGSVSANIITNNGQVIFDCYDYTVFSTFMTGAGGLVQEGSGTLVLPASNALSGPTTIANGQLELEDPNAVGSGLITIDNGGPTELELANGITVTNPVLIYSKGGALNGPPAIESENGTNALTGVLQATSAGTDVSIQTDYGSVLTIGGSFSYLSATSGQNVRLRGQGVGIWEDSIGNPLAGGAAVSIIVQDGGTWTLTGSSTNTYSGTTQVTAGTLYVDGQILSTSAVTISGEGALAGSGYIAGPVTLSGGVEIMPGDTNEPLSVSNVLTISNSLTLDGSSSAFFNLSETNGVLAYNRIDGLSSVSYNGRLVINLTGNLNGSEVFHLFNAASYSGAFTSYQLPSLPAALSWDTTQLAVDGTLRLAGGVSIQSASVNHGVFQLTGTSGVGTSGLPYRILATTNLTVPVGNWAEVSSGTLSGTPFTFIDTNSTNFTQRYYILVSP